MAKATRNVIETILIARLRFPIERGNFQHRIMLGDKLSQIAEFQLELRCTSVTKTRFSSQRREYGRSTPRIETIKHLSLSASNNPQDTNVSPNGYIVLAFMALYLYFKSEPSQLGPPFSIKQIQLIDSLQNKTFCFLFSSGLFIVTKIVGFYCLN